MEDKLPTRFDDNFTKFKDFEKLTLLSTSLKVI